MGSLRFSGLSIKEIIPQQRKLRPRGYVLAGGHLAQPRQIVHYSLRYSFSPASTVMRPRLDMASASDGQRAGPDNLKKLLIPSARTRAFAATVSPKPPLIRSFS